MTRADIQAALELAARRLEVVSETPLLDARSLLGHVSGLSSASILAHPERQLDAGQIQAFNRLLERLEAGEPLPYVCGEWEFFGRRFKVTRDTLIPRPETELLVETAVGWLQSHPFGRLALDVGTGSGCIGVSLALAAPGLRLLASDTSLPALRVARQNVLRYGVETQVGCVQADLLPPLGAPVDLLCANLPYIPSSKLPGLRVTRWEPPLALDGGATGLELIGRLLVLAPECMASRSLILLEIEATLGEPACIQARQAFPQADIRLLKDLAGLDRLVSIEIGS